MNSYRALKAKEIELALAALQERLEQCPRTNGQHVIVLERLEALLATYANELMIIQPIIHDAAFRSTVDFTLNQTSIFIFIVEMQYLRGVGNAVKGRIISSLDFPELCQAFRFGLD